MGQRGFDFATAVFEANRIDPLPILIGFEAERAKSRATQPRSPEESLSATVAKICATDRSIQRFCAARTLRDLGAAFPPCSLRRSRYRVDISLGSHPTHKRDFLVRRHWSPDGGGSITRHANQLRFCSWIIHRSIASRLKRQSAPTLNAGSLCSLSRR